MSHSLQHFFDAGFLIYGVDHVVPDMAQGCDERHLQETISRFGPDLVGFTMGALVLKLPNGVRADRVNREILENMKSVGFRKFAFRVEGGN